jgi:ectoine hydroxylase-related dioxygenase (phytanoyl-CoA dioxygenase family)
MDTKTALDQLFVNETSLTTEQLSQLDNDGYFVIEKALSPEQCEQMAAEVDRIAQAEAHGGGGEVSVEHGTTRVSNIFNKSSVFDCLLAIKPLLASAHYLLGEFKVHGANVREPHKGAGHQPLHSDSVKMGDGRWCLVNALIAFDPITLENGPTRIVPGSHKWAPLNVPGENAVYAAANHPAEPHRWAAEGESVQDHSAKSPVEGDEEKAPADPYAPYPGEVMITAPVGSVIICNAHIWHSGTIKESDQRRRLLALSYTRRDLPQQLIQRNYITPALYNRLSEAQRYLLDVVAVPTV